MIIRARDDRPVKFTTLAWIGNTELRACARCGATVMRSSVPNGDAMELVHRKWHEEQREGRRTNMPEQCPACTAELLHPEPICQDCGAATAGPDASRAAVP